VVGAGFPSNTMSPAPRPNSTSSGILIHSTVWSQRYRHTEQTNRTTVA